MITGVRKLAAVCHIHEETLEKKKKFFSQFYRCQQSRRAHSLFSPNTYGQWAREGLEAKQSLTKHIPFVGPFVMSCERCEGHQFFGVFLSSPQSSVIYPLVQKGPGHVIRTGKKFKKKGDGWTTTNQTIGAWPIWEKHRADWIRHNKYWYFLLY